MDVEVKAYFQRVCQEFKWLICEMLVNQGVGSEKEAWMLAKRFMFVWCAAAITAIILMVLSQGPFTSTGVMVAVLLIAGFISKRFASWIS